MNYYIEDSLDLIPVEFYKMFNISALPLKKILSFGFVGEQPNHRLVFELSALAAYTTVYIWLGSDLRYILRILYFTVPCILISLLSSLDGDLSRSVMLCIFLHMV